MASARARQMIAVRQRIFLPKPGRFSVSYGARGDGSAVDGVMKP
ncbi:hypothetical protein EBBID32_7210 [Sphingobium indicum BiD32]|uniref:Uncharacterized protein n=1 Tax=Sphingobium indicum BiD32 TaxID=1301087 RepID=N1MGP2_9SPHN|nr:hypothetical protein EBBID32_7210 [Sphingobium indicum BiD32]